MRRRPAAPALSVALLLTACGARPSHVVFGIGMTADTKESVSLAVTEINAQGGIGGVPLELLSSTEWVGRDAFDPATTLGWANRFIATRDLLAVVGHSDSASTLSAAALYNRGGVPHIVTIATNPAITGIGPWTYRLCLSDAAQGPALADYAVTEWKKRRIAIFYVNDDYGRELARRFEKRTRELGAEIVASVMHRNVLQADDQALISAALGRMKKETLPDLIALFQRLTTAEWTVQAIHDAGLDVDKLGGDTLAQYDLAEFRPDLTEGLRVSQFLYLDPANPRAVQFARAFRNLTGNDPDYSQTFAYDAVYLLRDAAQQGHYTRAGVKAYLDRLIAEKTTIRGVGGPFTLGQDHDARRQLYIAEIHNKGFRILKTLSAN